MPRPIILTRRFADRPLGEHASDYPFHTEVATEEELLEFANKLRAAGDADPLEALMPSQPGGSYDCLIANALNFSGRVDVINSGEPTWQDGSLRWAMYLPGNMDYERVQALAQAVDCEIEVIIYRFSSPIYAIKLPKHIGNVAHAFDSGDGFQEYA